jgi:hypothetical protein
MHFSYTKRRRNTFFFLQKGCGPFFNSNMRPTIVVRLIAHVTDRTSKTNIFHFFFRYGNIFHMDMGLASIVFISDYEMMKDMLSLDVFSGRINPTDIGLDFFTELRGGHGSHGLIGSQGNIGEKCFRTMHHLLYYSFCLLNVTINGLKQSCCMLSIALCCLCS